MHAICKNLLVILTFLILHSCGLPEKSNDDSLQSITDSIKHAYAPDKRVAIFNITLSQHGKKVSLEGETDQKEALLSLSELIVKKGYKVDNQAIVLPDSTVGNWKQAIVNNSVANIRSNPKHSAELATQAILGTPLKVLRITGDFFQVQTPDGYISWVDHGGVTLFSADDFNQWENKTKIIYTKPFGFVYQDEGNDLEKVSDIVLGAQLNLIEERSNYYKVEFPDQREGFLKKSESELYKPWLMDLKASGELLELYAKDLMGLPYLWGGTSSKGMDCSGFTKTIYLMNGYIIPRDASQQIMAGKNIDPTLEFEHLQKGDLMFFGKKATDSTRQRVTHVGIWLGNNKGEFIHASGKVKMGSINPDSGYYDAFNTNRYLGSRRYLGETDPALINLKTSIQTSQIKS